jgi:hypothetical protein
MAFDINSALVLPPTVWGYFEWFTGMVRINLDYKSYKRNKLSTVERLEVEETYNHEFFHCCQICTTGYLHYHVAQFLKEIAPFWRKLTKDVLARKKLSLMLVEVFKEKQTITAGMMKLFSTLDKPGKSHSVTARTIIESQAYLVQKQMSDRALKHEKFIKMLEQAPSEEYSEAYLMTAKYIGNDTFRHFHAIAYASLLFFEPQDVFEPICVHLSKLNLHEKDVASELKGIIDSLKTDNKYLGNNEDVTNLFFPHKEMNPFYKQSVRVLQQVCSEREIDYFGLMSDPALWLGEIITQFDLPIIFNNGDVHQHKKKHVFDESLDMTLHLILGTICLIISNQRQDCAPRYLHARK